MTWQPTQSRWWFLPSLSSVAYALACFVARLLVENAEPAEREVVTHGIGAIESGQAIGECARRFPVGGFTVVESEECGDAVDVRIDRHHQL